MWPASVKYMDRASVSFATQHVEDFADCCRSSTRQHRKLSSPSQSDQMWRMLTIFHPNSQNQAHIACTLAEEGTGDDRLLRSEMICALSLMREKRRLKAYLEHLIIPVFVYTFSGRRVRVVQVHFDGRHLVVRLTKYIDFEEENVDNIKLLIRYISKEPTRNHRNFVELDNLYDN